MKFHKKNLSNTSFCGLLCESTIERILKMPRLTVQQRIWVCIEFSRVDNAEEILRRWNYRWPNDEAPSAKTIRNTFAKFQREGTCHNLHKGNSGRRRTVRTPETKEIKFHPYVLVSR